MKLTISSAVICAAMFVGLPVEAASTGFSDVPHNWSNTLDYYLHVWGCQLDIPPVTGVGQAKLSFRGDRWKSLPAKILHANFGLQT